MFVHELCFLSTWLWNVARGRSGDKVQGRVLPKSHSCSKTFAGPKSLKDMASVSIFF
jgi:DNA polymerase eta